MLQLGVGVGVEVVVGVGLGVAGSSRPWQRRDTALAAGTNQQGQRINKTMRGITNRPHIGIDCVTGSRTRSQAAKETHKEWQGEGERNRGER